MLYIGGGVISADAHLELRQFAELTGLPVASTLMGLGAFDAEHPQSLYWFGMHGTVAGNWAVCESDLLIVQVQDLMIVSLERSIFLLQMPLSCILI